MLKSLHYLTASVARAIMLVALFVVGMTASADRYQVSFCKEGMNDFRDRSIHVTSSARADSDGLTISSSSKKLRFFYEDPHATMANKGIGRIIFTAAPDMTEKDLKNAVQNFSSRNYKLVYAGDHKILCTPSQVTGSLDVEFTIGILYLGSRPIKLTSAEVFTGYTVKEAFEYELSLADPDVSYNDTYDVEAPFSYTTDATSTNWNTANAWSSGSGVEINIPAGNVCTFGDDRTALRLNAGRLCFIPKVNDVRIYADADGRATFDIFAPAGFAVSGVTFRGEGIERITSEHGSFSGNMDRIWHTSEAKPSLDYARFYYTSASDEDCLDLSSVTVTYQSLGSHEDVRFEIDETNVSPAVEGDMVFHYNDADFDVIVTAPEGVQFTSVAPSFDARMTINGNVYVSGVRGILDNDGTILFNVSFPAETYDVEGPFDFMVRFPEGVICADESYNREFCHTFHFFRGVTDEHVKVSPVELANLKELREIRVTSLIGGPFELVADRATFTYGGINGWATVGASVRLVNGAVVYTLDEPLVAGVNVNGETNIFNSPEVVYHLLGLAGGIPYTLTYNFDANINTVSPVATIPATDDAVSVGDVYTLDDRGNGLFVSYAEPITDAAGQPLEHGSNLWASYYDQPEGYQLIATYGSGEDQDTADRSCAGCVLVGNAQGQYGFLVPLDPAEAAVYHLTVPEGTFYVGGKPNAAIDLTWNLIDTEPDGMFAIVSPNRGQTYKYVDKLVVAPQYGFTYYPEIVSVAERTKVNVSMAGKTSGSINTREAWATGTLENGNAVYTFDEPITCNEEASATFLLPIGVLETEMGRTNAFIDGVVTINPDLKYNKVCRTLPVAEQITTFQKLADEQNSFEVIFDDALDAISVNSEDIFYLNGSLPYGYMLYTPNNLNGSGISVTHVETGEPVSELLVFVPSDWGGQRVVAFHSDQTLAPGHYRVQCPAGAIRFNDGSVNEPIDLTWNVVESFSAEQLAINYPSQQYSVPFRRMSLRPVYDPTTVAEFKLAPLAQKTANVDVFFSQGAGRVVGTFSTDESGNLNIEFSETIEFPGQVTVRIPGGVFYDTTGRVNPKLEYTYSIDHYELGYPEGMPDLVNSIGTIHVPIYNDATVNSVPADYYINVTAYGNDPATGERKVLLGLKERKDCVSLSRDENGQSYLDITLPERFSTLCNQIPGERTTIEVELPGLAYSYVNTNVIPNVEGLPNQALTFQFTVWPDVRYTYTLNAIDMPRGAQIMVCGRAVEPTPTGEYTISGLTAPLTAEDVTIKGLPADYPYNVTQMWLRGDRGGATIDFRRFTDVLYYPFENNTVAQDDVMQVIGFVYDREIDQSTFNSESYRSNITLTDENYEPIEIAWASANTGWFGVGLNSGYELRPGTYTFRAPAQMFQFVDGSWNSYIEYTFTVTEPTRYAFQQTATFYIDGTVQMYNQTPGLGTKPFTRLLFYLPEGTQFNSVSKEVEVSVVKDGTWSSMEAEATLHQPNTSIDPRPYLSLLFWKDEAHTQAVEFGAGEYEFYLPAGLIDVNGGLTNRDYATYVKVTDPNTLNLVVNLSAEYSSNFPIEIYNIGSSAPGVIAVSGDAVHFDPSRQEIRVPEELSAYYEYRENSIYNGELTVSVSRRALTLYSAEADGHGGLRSATFGFDKGIVPGLFRSRISWSEGFRLQRKNIFAYSDVANDIDYVTTSVENNELTLHFFSAEGRELFPMDKKSGYRLTVPFNAIFAYGNLINGYLLGLPYDSERGIYTLNFDVTEPQVITDDPDYDEAHPSLAEQTRTFADILLGSRRSGSRTNDFNADGSLTIVDLVQFIEQSKPQTDPDLETPDNETTIWFGEESLNQSNPLYIGENGGAEFSRNNVKAGMKVRFYFDCSAPESSNWLLIDEGHWGAEYIKMEDFSEEQGYVTLTLTQEMIDAALTPQWGGGIFLLMGSECLTLKMVTVFGGTSSPVEPVDPVEPVEGEEVLWSGSHNLSWNTEDFLYVGSDGGTELKELGAKVGSVIRVYGEMLGDHCSVQVQEGHWAKMYGNFEASSQKPMPACGYFAFTLTQEMLDQLYAAYEYVSGSFLIHGVNFRVTKVALVPDYDPNTDPNVGIHPTLPGDNGDPVL